MLRRRALTLTIGLFVAAALEPSVATAEKHVAPVIEGGAFSEVQTLHNAIFDTRIATALQVNGSNDLNCECNRPGCFDLTGAASTKFLLDSSTRAGLVAGKECGSHPQAMTLQTERKRHKAAPA